jgi:hypothetical protein
MKLMEATTMILREEVAFNGFLFRLEYNQFALGDKYRIRYKKPDEYSFRYDTSWATMGEAARYFDKLIKGGR